MWRNGGREGNFSLGPHPAPHISCLLSFFKGNLFLDISKTHLKAIFTLWLQSRLQPPPSAPILPPSHVAPDVSQSPFLGSQHSFDLILRAICNPLQDTEARSPAHHTTPLYLTLYLPFFSFALTGPCLFIFLLYQPAPLTSQLPCRPTVGLSTHLIHAGIIGLQSTKDLLQVFIEKRCWTANHYDHQNALIFSIFFCIVI